MKIRTVMPILLIAGLLCLTATASFGEEMAGPSQQDEINMLEQSSQALKTSNPKLVEELDKYISNAKKETILGEGKEGDTEYNEDIKLLTECASLLKTSDPKLSEGLSLRAAKEQVKLDALKKDEL